MELSRGPRSEWDSLAKTRNDMVYGDIKPAANGFDLNVLNLYLTISDRRLFDKRYGMN